eukprot:TRINITY_DN8192_c0_g1_i1.p1 TRINITY_DN8192_c0_g1~~TRINITY_DN8192_c0_g1_i1.p1  ORF type:complete len:475 (+),score=127.95 TRINITY_DN8192_c0_g1_i1:27-1427(+)
MGCGVSLNVPVAQAAPAPAPEPKPHSAHLHTHAHEHEHGHGHEHEHHGHKRSKGKGRQGEEEEEHEHSTHRVVYELWVHGAAALPCKDSSVIMDAVCAVELPGASAKRRTPAAECDGSPIWEEKFTARGSIGPIRLTIVDEDVLTNSEQVAKLVIVPAMLPFVHKEFKLELERASENPAEKEPTITLSAGVIPDYWNIKCKLNSVPSFSFLDCAKTVFVSLKKVPAIVSLAFSSGNSTSLHVYETVPKPLVVQLKFAMPFKVTLTKEQHEKLAEKVHTFQVYNKTTWHKFSLCSPLEGCTLTVSGCEPFSSHTLSDLLVEAGVPVGKPLRDPATYAGLQTATLDNAREFAYVHAPQGCLQIPLHASSPNGKEDNRPLSWLLAQDAAELGLVGDLQCDFFCARQHTTYERPKALAQAPGTTTRKFVSATTIKDSRWADKPGAVRATVWRLIDPHAFRLWDVLPLKIL